MAAHENGFLFYMEPADVTFKLSSSAAIECILHTYILQYLSLEWLNAGDSISCPSVVCPRCYFRMYAHQHLPIMIASVSLKV